ncbi:uncharacterized protein SPPG_04056 [Spizellomyces punctatus DAOM BR117]|uniref:Uncharacterized protein n=1 Tax=Spizellomyces punctatus (strain DAOM BR117) TaxID=645134 RepID=A0A0L0HHK7_SPIPD|nr:uncharacterized protein SPPG_04056 [Spizellomyces punctatus DAOM BR117]KND00956.1 hypothetical protein SPPG_04056 [Spizellomyces punctatus DAOM BR117]|eukprot:XP_016608995.1 hypothetical protein SPPG_04056 [Spizellomyces punctatus DAOM BR117]
MRHFYICQSSYSLQPAQLHLLPPVSSDMPKKSMRKPKSKANAAPPTHSLSTVEPFAFTPQSAPANDETDVVTADDQVYLRDHSTAQRTVFTMTPASNPSPVTSYTRKLVEEAMANYLQKRTKKKKERATGDRSSRFRR